MTVVGSSGDNNKQKELFVIQRCWFSGPQLDPPVDYLRLFETRRDAEEIAYHSAHTFAADYVKKRGNSASSITVRTILLPPSSNNGNSSYAFQTCGKLFWVRSILATWVGNNGSGSPLAQNINFSLLSSTRYCCKAVLTQGVIGGTGNVNSRRGVEISQGRVFVRIDESLLPQPWTSTNIVQQMASHVATQVQESLPKHVNVTVQSLLIGKPPENSFHHKTHNYNLEDWPVQIGQQEDDSTALKKRDLNLHHHSDYNNNNNVISPMNNHDETSSSKRFRFEHHQHQQEQQQGDDMMMM